MGISRYKDIEKRRKWERNFDYMRNYGITTDDYNRMFDEQEGRCAICLKHQSEFNKRLHVDHCHKTNQVRGLLCHNCNLSIGRLGEDIKTLERAIRYLQNVR